MAIPIHSMHLYQKPRLGTAFIRRLPVYNYSHEINAMGGFDTAQFDVALRSVDEGQQFLDQYLGNRVAIYVDNPAEPIWEGFINRMTFSAGEVQYSISLDEMINRVQVQYITTVITPTITTRVNNTDSQAVYGIKHGVIDMNVAQATVSTAAIDAMRDNILNQRAWPKTSITRGQGNGLLHIECLGFYHTLGWEVWSDANALAQISNGGTTNLPWMLNGATLSIGTAGNASTFFDHDDFTDLAVNTLQYTRTSNRGETFWERFMALAEVGSSTDYYVIGIGPTNFQTGLRRMYYRPANFNVEYTARQRDGLRIRDIYGKIVPPWTVRPDRGIRVSDMLVGWNGLGDDPAETWIRSITYDANSQRVDYQGDDDRTAEGVFQFNRIAKQTGRRFGVHRSV